MTYAKLPDSDRQETSEQYGDDQEGTFYGCRTQHARVSLAIAWLLSIALAWIVARWYYLSGVSRASRCVETVAAVDYNSPLYGRLNPRFENITPDRSLWDDGSSIYRHDPSPETDAAWEALVNWNPILISESDMAQLGLPTEGAVKWPEAQSDRQYVARMDIFHLLHCVNELRKGSWFDYYTHHATNETLNPAHYDHKKHCFDIIRQEIMCTGSMNLYRLIWSEHQQRPWPEFTIHRTCRRWDDIMDWYGSHKMSDEDFAKLPHMQKPAGEFAVPMSPQGIRMEEAVDAWQKKWGLEEWND